MASNIANASHSKKHDDSNVVIDLEDARKAKKTAGIGPSKPWSKVEIKKRKVKDDSKPEEDVEEDVPDISPTKKTTIRKSPIKVHVVHLDNISFHLEDGAAKWKFVIQRRVAMERELGKDVADVKENSKEFYKVYVRGKCITFSPTVINNFLGRKNEGAGELEVTDNQVCREITAKQVKVWSFKKHLPAGKLTIKYAILHKIGATNWVPTNHISTIANTLGRFIFVVGTKVKFDYGRFVFDQIIKHATTNAVKLPIAFPSMIYGIILNQPPGILCSNDLPSRRKPVLFVHYKLF
ncbi:uncharacterized protein LOC127131022 [Lathyrus oleraceus]|uniref:uncharacterized protein LOC127131022 n=1 Tax=Pisum sativum TaxID=3888 RepID=UPI0021CF4067|nr:uncharacterized protein LOC127131022 [Pisum sativum]